MSHWPRESNKQMRQGQISSRHHEKHVSHALVTFGVCFLSKYNAMYNAADVSCLQHQLSLDNVSLCRLVITTISHLY